MKIFSEKQPYLLANNQATIMCIYITDVQLASWLTAAKNNLFLNENYYLKVPLVFTLRYQKTIALLQNFLTVQEKGRIDESAKPNVIIYQKLHTK